MGRGGSWRCNRSRTVSVFGVTDRPRILVCGWSGAGNVGDELLTTAAADLIRDAGGVPVVRSVDVGRSATAHPGTEVVGRGLRHAMVARRVDGVVLGPGGIIQDDSSPWSLPAHLWPALTARILRRPVVGVGLGAVPLRRWWSRRLLRLVLRRVDVVARDPASVAAFTAAGVDAAADVDLAAAAAAAAPARPKPEVEAEGGGAATAVAGSTGALVIAAGPRPRSGGWSRGRDRLAFDDAVPLAALVDELAPAFDGAAFVAYRGDRDIAAAHEFVDRCSVPIDVIADDAEAAVAATRRAALVVTSRYHAAVVAVTAGVPVIALMAEPKLESLVAEIADPARLEGVRRWTDARPDIDRRNREPYEFASTGVAARTVVSLVSNAARRRAR